MTVAEVLARYEVAVGAHRVKVKHEDLMIREAWTRVCAILEERALNATTRDETRRLMRAAAREIRAALALRQDLVRVDDKVLKRGANRQRRYVVNEVLDELREDKEFMQAQAIAGHPWKRRLNSACLRVANVIDVVEHNVETNEATTPQTKKDEK